MMSVRPKNGCGWRTQQPTEDLKDTLIDQPWKIMSIARRDWAAAGHSI